MKLTFFMSTDLRTGAGTERVAVELIKNKPPDVDITIIETDFLDREMISGEEVNKIAEKCKRVRIPYPKLYKITKNRFVFYGILLILKPLVRLYNHLPDYLIKEIHNTDIVYFFNNSYSVFYKNFSDKILLIGTCHTGCPIISETNATDSKKSIRKYLSEMLKNRRYKIYESNLNGVHLFNANLLDLYPYKYKMVLPNGIDTSKYYPNLSIDISKKNKLKFLYVSRLEKYKGVLIIYEILRKLSKESNYSNYEFHIVGGGSMESLFNKITKINKNVIYHGIIYGYDLEKLYRDCDVFVYPTLADSFALVVLEALSSGLYVLTTKTLRGIYDDFLGKNLEYLDADPISFYNRITDIMKNKGIIMFDKEKVYNYIKNNYDWKIISDKFYAYMREFYSDFYKR